LDLQQQQKKRERERGREGGMKEGRNEGRKGRKERRREGKRRGGREGDQAAFLRSESFTRGSKKLTPGCHQKEEKERQRHGLCGLSLQKQHRVSISRVGTQMCFFCFY
jgi:hypothetical protein